VIRSTRNYKPMPFEPSDYDLEDWAIFTAISILYPVGLWHIFTEWLDDTV